MTLYFQPFYNPYHPHPHELLLCLQSRVGGSAFEPRNKCHFCQIRLLSQNKILHNRSHYHIKENTQKYNCIVCIVWSLDLRLRDPVIRRTLTFATQPEVMLPNGAH